MAAVAFVNRVSPQGAKGACGDFHGSIAICFVGGLVTFVGLLLMFIDMLQK